MIVDYLSMFQTMTCTLVVHSFTYLFLNDYYLLKCNKLKVFNSSCSKSYFHLPVVSRGQHNLYSGKRKRYFFSNKKWRKWPIGSFKFSGAKGHKFVAQMSDFFGSNFLSSGANGILRPDEGYSRNASCVLNLIATFYY